VPSRAEIVTFDDSPPPPGADSWVPGAAPSTGIEVTEADPASTPNPRPAPPPPAPRRAPVYVPLTPGMP